MKKFALFLLTAAFVFAAGCGQAPELLTATETTSVITETEPVTEAEPATEEEPLTEEATTAEEKLKKVFSYSEIDTKFGPGPFSVNELARVFGEPVKLLGTIYSMSSGDVCLHAEFDGLSFELIPKDGTVSFDFDTIWDNNMSENPVTSQDKNIKIKPFTTTITSEKIDFIRGIKIGDRKEKIIAAYDGYAGYEWVNEGEGITYVLYYYRPDKIIKYTDDEQFNVASQTGDVCYSFSNGKLTEIGIAWYDGYLAFD